jgi:hypothetical protein
LLEDGVGDVLHLRAHADSLGADVHAGIRVSRPR